MTTESDLSTEIQDNSVSDLLVDLWNTGLYDAVDACMQEEAKQAAKSARVKLVSQQMGAAASEEGALTVCAEGAATTDGAMAGKRGAAPGKEAVSTRNRMFWSVAFKIRSAVFSILLIAVVSLVLAMLLNPDMSISQLCRTMLERVG